MHADACELASLEEAGLATCDVVIAATGDDKVNLVVSLLAKTEFAVTASSRGSTTPRNEWLFRPSWGVDVAVSTPRVLAALVEEAVTVGDLVRLMTFRQGQANLVEVTLPEDTPLGGPAGGRLKLPADSALVVVLRGGRVIVPQAGRRAGARRRAAVRGDCGRRGRDPRRAGLLRGQSAGLGRRRARDTAQIVPSSATPTSG